MLAIQSKVHRNVPKVLDFGPPSPYLAQTHPRALGITPGSSSVSFLPGRQLEDGRTQFDYNTPKGVHAAPGAYAC